MTMKVLVGLLVLVVVVAAAFAESPAFNYHRKFGLARAAEIKRIEENAAKNNSQRIVGGSWVQISEIPYQAGLLNHLWFGTTVCGGSLISHTRVVTVAHCHFDGQSTADSHTVVLGSHTIFFGGNRQISNNVVMHPSFNINTLANNVAVIIINPVAFTANIQPIALPSGNQVNINYAGYVGLASGFGFYNDFQQSIPNNQAVTMVTLPIIQHSECQKVYGQLVQTSNLCTNGYSGKGVCRGDSGGPLTVQTGNTIASRILVGIISFSHEQCQAGFPSVYVRVPSYLQWIQSV